MAQKPQVTINEVMVDFDSQSISIMGENFDIGPNPTTASLGGFGNLNIISNDGSTIVAELPPGISAGDYTLFVSSGPGPKKNDQQSITNGQNNPHTVFTLTYAEISFRTASFVVVQINLCNLYIFT